MSEPTVKRPASARAASPILLPGDRPLPHDHEAEMAVLGCMLMDPDGAIGPAAVRLNFDNSFFAPAHQTIFKTLITLHESRSQAGGAAVDSITAANALQIAGQLEKTGGMAYLAQLMNVVPSSANIEQYAEIVQERAILRRLVQTGIDIAGRCMDSQTPVRELVDQIESDILEINKLGGAGSALRPVKDHMGKVIEMIQNGISTHGLKTGFAQLDELTGGLKPGDMFVLAARPSIGKTALALNMATNAALGPSKHSVGVFSLEMSSEQLVMRLLYSLASISQNELKSSGTTTRRFQELMNAADRLSKSRLFIDDSGNLDIFSLREKARRLSKASGLDLLIIDYLQLIRPVGGNRNSTRENDVSQISGGIKSLAKELGIPIIVLAQLNRQAEQKGEKPKLSHLRESGAIEQDADIVALLHRDRDLDAGIDPEKEQREAELLIAKHRNGSTGVIPLTFIPKYTRFETRSRISDDEVPAHLV